MNTLFLESFATHLDTQLACKVILAKEDQIIGKSSIFICANHCGLLRKHGALYLEHLESIDSLYNPSVDALFSSALALGRNYDIMAILLTGIGADGAKSLAALYKSGATCIAESEQTAIVYGMPKRALELEPMIKVLSLDEIIKAIQLFMSDC